MNRSMRPGLRGRSRPAGEQRRALEHGHGHVAVDDQPVADRGMRVELA